MQMSDFDISTAMQTDAFAALCASAAAQAEATEAARAVPRQLAEAMAAQGLFALYVPEKFAGRQDDPLLANSKLYHLARHDAASAWVAMIGSTASIGAAYLPDDVAGSLYGGGTAITCGIFAPQGTAVADGEDYIVNGRWAWASGSANASHIGLGCRIVTDPPESAKMPETRLVMLPVEALIKHDNWYTLGLCGSSSGDVEAVNIRVPKSHSFSILTEAPRVHAPLYRMPYFGLLASGIAAIALGNGRAALDDFIDLAQAKTPTGTGKTLAQRATVQARLAEAEATWRAANSYFWQMLKDVWAVAQSDTPLDENLRADFRLAATHAVRQALQVVRDMHDLAGGTAVYKTSPLQRRLRDGETMTQHVMTNAASYEMVGRVQLGGFRPDMLL